MKRQYIPSILLCGFVLALTGCGGGGTDSIAPTTPTGVQATVSGDNRIDLAWAPATDIASLAGYKVYRDGGHIGSSQVEVYSDTGSHRVSHTATRYPP